MQQTHPVLVNGTDPVARLTAQAERENLLNNLTSLRRTLWDMRAKICQLDRLLEETRAARTETVLLQADINAIAEKLGLEPIPKYPE